MVVNNFERINLNDSYVECVIKRWLEIFYLLMLFNLEWLCLIRDE